MWLCKTGVLESSGLNESMRSVNRPILLLAVQSPATALNFLSDNIEEAIIYHNTLPSTAMKKSSHENLDL